MADLADEIGNMLRIAMFSAGIANIQALKGTSALRQANLVAAQEGACP